MVKTTIITSLILIILGVTAALVFQAKTALIPAYFGLPLLGCGLLALKESMRKHAMHGASLLALLGTLMPGAMVVMALVKLAGGGEIARPYAIGLQAAMALVCGVFLILCIQSFIQARRNRQAQTVA